MHLSSREVLDSMGNQLLELTSTDSIQLVNFLVLIDRELC
jgi:hypothetical protein